jgi:hypothetical protein
VKLESAGSGPREHAVEHQCVNVDVEIHRSAEPLNHSDTAAAGIRETLAASPGTLVPLDRPMQ